MLRRVDHVWFFRGFCMDPLSDPREQLLCHLLVPAEMEAAQGLRFAKDLGQKLDRRFD